MSSYGPITDTFEEEMADGTRIRYECVHTDDEWLAEILNIVGHRILRPTVAENLKCVCIDNYHARQKTD